MATPAVSDSANSWTLKAACRGLSTDLFFHAASAAEAKAVCAVCPVRAECYDFAMANESRDDIGVNLGVYGGHTSEERRLKWRHWRREQLAKKGR